MNPSQELLLARSNLGIEMFEFAWSYATFGNKRIHFALLQPDNSPESVCRQLAFIDQSIQRPRGQAQSCGRFFGRKPVTVCRSHRSKRSTLLHPLSHFQPTTLTTEAASPGDVHEF